LEASIATIDSIVQTEEVVQILEAAEVAGSVTYKRCTRGRRDDGKATFLELFLSRIELPSSRFFQRVAEKLHGSVEPHAFFSNGTVSRHMSLNRTAFR